MKRSPKIAVFIAAALCLGSAANAQGKSDNAGQGVLTGNAASAGALFAAHMSGFGKQKPLDNPSRGNQPGGVPGGGKVTAGK